MFISLEGIDGSGKTTLAKELAKKNDDLYFVSRKDLPSVDGFIKEQMRKVASLMWTSNHGMLDHLLPTDYWIFLQLTWYCLLYEFTIKPLIESKKNIVIDGWYYKFWARLELQNIDIKYLKVLFSHIPAPDHVILLDVNVEDIFLRKTGFKAYEMGSHITGQSENTTTSFMEFQNGTFKNLKKYSSELDWDIVDLPSSDIECNCNKINEILARFYQC